MPSIEIKLQRPRIDKLLDAYKDAIGEDLPGYRNHVYRVTTYAMYFLDNTAHDEQAVETALAYHDIGLWTDHELAYLEPSEVVAALDNEKNQWGIDQDLLRGIIHWHHKVFRYRGPQARVIEACRKADWIDATKGLIRKGMPRANIRATEDAFPNLGFHNTLLRLARDLGGSTIAGGLKVTRGIVKW